MNAALVVKWIEIERELRNAHAAGLLLILLTVPSAEYCPARSWRRLCPRFWSDPGGPHRDRWAPLAPLDPAFAGYLRQQRLRTALKACEQAFSVSEGGQKNRACHRGHAGDSTSTATGTDHGHGRGRVTCCMMGREGFVGGQLDVPFGSTDDAAAVSRVGGKTRMGGAGMGQFEFCADTQDATDSSNPNRVLQGLQEAKAGRVRGKARELMRQMRTRVRELDGRNQELRKALLEAVEARTKQKILQQGASIQAAAAPHEGGDDDEDDDQEQDQNEPATTQRAPPTAIDPEIEQDEGKSQGAKLQKTTSERGSKAAGSKAAAASGTTIAKRTSQSTPPDVVKKRSSSTSREAETRETPNDEEFDVDVEESSTSSLELVEEGGQNKKSSSAANSSRALPRGRGAAGAGGKTKRLPSTRSKIASAAEGERRGSSSVEEEEDEDAEEVTVATGDGHQHHAKKKSTSRLPPRGAQQTEAPREQAKRGASSSSTGSGTGEENRARSVGRRTRTAGKPSEKKASAFKVGAPHRQRGANSDRGIFAPHKREREQEVEPGPGGDEATSGGKPRRKSETALPRHLGKRSRRKDGRDELSPESSSAPESGEEEGHSLPDVVRPPRKESSTSRVGSKRPKDAATVADRPSRASSSVSRSKAAVGKKQVKIVVDEKPRRTKAEAEKDTTINLDASSRPVHVLAEEEDEDEARRAERKARDQASTGPHHRRAPVPLRRKPSSSTSFSESSSSEGEEEEGESEEDADAAGSTEEEDISGSGGEEPSESDGTAEEADEDPRSNAEEEQAVALAADQMKKKTSAKPPRKKVPSQAEGASSTSSDASEEWKEVRSKKGGRTNVKSPSKTTSDGRSSPPSSPTGAPSVGGAGSATTTSGTTRSAAKPRAAAKSPTAKDAADARAAPASSRKRREETSSRPRERGKRAPAPAVVKSTTGVRAGKEKNADGDADSRPRKPRPKAPRKTDTASDASDAKDVDSASRQPATDKAPASAKKKKKKVAINSAAHQPPGSGLVDDPNANTSEAIVDQSATTTTIGGPEDSVQTGGRGTNHRESSGEARSKRKRAPSLELHAEDEVVEQSPKGRFSRFNRRLGAGSYKQVYLGFDNDTGREIAWNVISFSKMSETEMKRIQEEISITKSLNHSRIIHCMSAWKNSEHEIRENLDYLKKQEAQAASEALPTQHQQPHVAPAEIVPAVVVPEQHTHHAPPMPPTPAPNAEEPGDPSSASAIDSSQAPSRTLTFGAVLGPSSDPTPDAIFAPPPNPPQNQNGQSQNPAFPPRSFVSGGSGRSETPRAAGGFPRPGVERLTNMPGFAQDDSILQSPKRHDDYNLNRDPGVPVVVPPLFPLANLGSKPGGIAVAAASLDEPGNPGAGVDGPEQNPATPDFHRRGLDASAANNVLAGQVGAQPHQPQGPRPELRIPEDAQLGVTFAGAVAQSSFAAGGQNAVVEFAMTGVEDLLNEAPQLPAHPPQLHQGEPPAAEPATVAPSQEPLQLYTTTPDVVPPTYVVQRVVSSGAEEEHVQAPQTPQHLREAVADALVHAVQRQEQEVLQQHEQHAPPQHPRVDTFVHQQPSTSDTADVTTTTQGSLTPPIGGGAVTPPLDGAGQRQLQPNEVKVVLRLDEVLGGHTTLASSTSISTTGKVVEFEFDLEKDDCHAVAKEMLDAGVLDEYKPPVLAQKTDTDTSDSQLTEAVAAHVNRAVAAEVMARELNTSVDEEDGGVFGGGALAVAVREMREHMQAFKEQRRLEKAAATRRRMLLAQQAVLEEASGEDDSFSTCRGNDLQGGAGGEGSKINVPAHQSFLVPPSSEVEPLQDRPRPLPLDVDKNLVHTNGNARGGGATPQHHDGPPFFQRADSSMHLRTYPESMLPNNVNKRPLAEMMFGSFGGPAAAESDGSGPAGDHPRNAAGGSPVSPPRPRFAHEAIQGTPEGQESKTTGGRDLQAEVEGQGLEDTNVEDVIEQYVRTGGALPVDHSTHTLEPCPGAGKGERTIFHSVLAERDLSHERVLADESADRSLADHLDEWQRDALEKSGQSKTPPSPSASKRGSDKPGPATEVQSSEKEKCLVKEKFDSEKEKKRLQQAQESQSNLESLLATWNQ
eukprot:g7442.t1